MRLFRLCLAGTNLRVLHSRLAQTSFIDESVDSTSNVLCLSHDVGKLVIRSERLRYQPSILPRNNGETHSHRTRACVEHNFERRMRHCVRGNYNAVQKIVRSTNHLTRTRVELKMLPTSGCLVVRIGSVESQDAFKETNTAPRCSTIQIKV